MSGKPLFMDLTVFPLITSEAAGAVIRIDNVTDRKITEDALRESQEKYELVVENANDGIIIIQDGIIKFANRQTTALSGYTIAELTSSPFVSFVLKEDHDYVMKMQVARMQGRPVSPNYTFRLKNKKGPPVWVNTSSVAITWNNHPATLNFVRDITDQKRTEERLAHTQKMEAIGTLAGGIAHDFNNLLQVIQGYTQLLLYDNKDHAKSHRELKAIQNAAKKGGELTMQLLTFGRKVESHPQPININHQIQKTIKMLSRTIPKMIDIQLRLAKNVATVYVDPGQIEQVVMNLVLNARDAMSDGGRIAIETETVSLDETAVKNLHVPKPGKYVRLIVSDSGHGISEEVLNHIFEPFFTTKKLGDGTGLGLAIVYGIIKNHSGGIICESVLEEGTTFTVYFPAAEVSGMLARKKPAATIAAPVGGSETILLVDDEDTIRDIGQQLLEKFGYSVLTASNAEEALEIYTPQQDRIPLVILDLVMPGMGGIKCIDVLLEVNPKVKIIIASGYLSSIKEDSDDEQALLKTNGFIKKPFILEDILHEVRRVLDGKDA
jgi:PAS domain S-box-containing protein